MTNIMLSPKNLEMLSPQFTNPMTLRLVKRSPALTLPEMETRYHAAKARLLAAQDEKAEATAEFERARTALRLCFEEIWPDRSE